MKTSLLVLACIPFRKCSRTLSRRRRDTSFKAKLIFYFHMNFYGRNLFGVEPKKLPLGREHCSF